MIFSELNILVCDVIAVRSVCLSPDQEVWPTMGFGGGGLKSLVVS